MRRISLVVAALLLLPTLQDPTPPKPVSPEVGKPAPPFRLNDHEGNAVQVGGKQKTWTVLAFYPKAATPG